MKHSSDLLMHFLGRAHRDDPVAQVATCRSILNSGLRFSRQSADFGSSVAAPGLAYRVDAVCFTDIPLRLSEAHAARYGRCAIGIRKSLVKRWGGNPVLYLVDRRTGVPPDPPQFHLRTDFRGVFGEYVMHMARMLTMPADDKNFWFNTLEPTAREQAKSEIGYLLSHVKEMFDLGADVDGEDEPKRDRYYMEREWRVCLSGIHRAAADHPDGSRTVIKTEDGRYLLPLGRKDARVVVVPNEWARIELLRFLSSDGWAPEEIPTIINYDDSKDL